MTIKIYDKEHKLCGRFALIEKISYKYNEHGCYTNIFLKCMGQQEFKLTIPDEDKDKIIIELEA